jgi:hypothetical protein
VCESASLKTFWRALARGPGARAVGGAGGDGDRGVGTMEAGACSGGGIADGIVVGCVILLRMMFGVAGAVDT